MPVTYIYTLSDPVTNQVRYIGKSVNPKIRYNRHLNDRIQTHCSRWIADLARRGLKPIMAIVSQVPDGDDWQRVEQSWIDWGRGAGWNLTNITAGGEGALGTRQSEETRRKKSEQQKGRIITDEARRKMSEAKRGKPVSQACLDRAIAAVKGKSFTDEHRARISIALKGKTQVHTTRPKSPETRAKMSEAAKHRTPEQQARMTAAIRETYARKKAEREAANAKS